MITTYKDGMYHNGYFRGGSNIDLKIIMCKDNIVIPSILQNYVLHWYHAYLLRSGMDRTETNIHQHFYWPDIRYSVRNKVSNCDSCQHTKLSNKEYGKSPAKLSE